MHSHVWCSHCAKFDDDVFNSFRGIACEGHPHRHSLDSTLKFALQTKRPRTGLGWNQPRFSVFHYFFSLFNKILKKSQCLNVEFLCFISWARTTSRYYSKIYLASETLIFRIFLLLTVFFGWGGGYHDIITVIVAELFPMPYVSDPRRVVVFFMSTAVGYCGCRN